MKFMWFDGNSGSNCVFLLSYAFENIGKLVQYIVWCDYICIFNLYIWFDLPVRRLWPLGHTAGVCRYGRLAIRARTIDYFIMWQKEDIPAQQAETLADGGCVRRIMILPPEPRTKLVLNSWSYVV